MLAVRSVTQPGPVCEPWESQYAFVQMQAFAHSQTSWTQEVGRGAAVRLRLGWDQQPGSVFRTLDGSLRHARPCSLCEVTVFYWMSSEIISAHIMTKESHFLKRGNHRELVKCGPSGCFPDGPSSAWLFLSTSPRAACRGRRAGRAAADADAAGRGAQGQASHLLLCVCRPVTRTCGQRPSDLRATEPSPSRPSACRGVSTGLERQSLPEEGKSRGGVTYFPQPTLLSLDLI